MSSIKLTRPDTQAPAAADQGTRAPVGEFCAGTEFVLRCRYAEAFINATTAPVALQWEGPYLRIYPGLPNITDRAETRMGKKLGEPGSLYAVQGGAGTVSPLGEMFPFYEIDAVNVGPIYLPFPARVELYTALSGAWLYDFVSWELPPHKTPVRRYAQTRLVRRGAAARALEVPLGCYSFSPIAFADDNTYQYWAEETGKTAGNGSSELVNIQQFPGSYPYGIQELPIGNSRKIRVASTATRDTGVVFNIKF